MCQNVCVTCVCFPNVLLRRAQFYSPALRCAVRSIVQPPAQFLGPRAAEQPVLQRLETLQKVCALVAFSTAYIHTIIQPPPSLRSIVRIIALCPARRGSIVRSTAQCPARRVAQENALHVPCDHPHARSIAQCPARRVALENALHVPCDHTARSITQCPALHYIANIVQRSVLAAVSPSQVKPSAAASGGTTRKFSRQ